MRFMNRSARREKRVHPRVSVEIAVSCERPGAPPVLGTARDLGVGGVFIESTQVVPFGTELVIVARLPGMNTGLRLPGLVRWAKLDGFGVQFGLLGARETHGILALMKVATVSAPRA
jgi:type IV pilus assembly protein PilZ